MLGQDFARCCDWFLDFPPFSSWPALFNLQVCRTGFRLFIQYFRTYRSSLVTFKFILHFIMASSGMRRAHSEAFQDPSPPILEPKTRLHLHIALSPIQFQPLLDQRPILPGPYSSRFGLQETPSRQWRGHIISCAGAFPTMSLLLKLPSRILWFAPFDSVWLVTGTIIGTRRRTRCKP